MEAEEQSRLLASLSGALARLLSRHPLAMMTMCWAALAALAMWELSLRPRGLTQWLLLVLLGPVVLFVLNVAVEGGFALLHRLPGIGALRAEVERSKAEHTFSGARGWYILFQLTAVGVILALVWVAMIYIQRLFGFAV